MKRCIPAQRVNRLTTKIANITYALLIRIKTISQQLKQHPLRLETNLLTVTVEVRLTYVEATKIVLIIELTLHDQM